MFLCDKCAPKHGVSSVETLIYLRSLGECEECHCLESCMDVPFVAAQHLRALDAGESTVKMGYLTPEEDAAIKADNMPTQRK